MNLIVYLIDKNAEDFFSDNSELFGRGNIILDEDDLHAETRLFDEDVSLYVSGQVTFMKLGIKYGASIMHDNIRKRVDHFERHLLALTPFRAIYRVDESLIEEFSLFMKNENWFRTENVLDCFAQWILKQETLHWQKLA